LQAEAIIRSNGTLATAKSLLKTVLGHAGITDFSYIDAITDKDVLLNEVYNEYVRNLSYEDGIEWFALIRFPIEKVKAIKPAIVDKNYIILPFPATEFEKNPTLGDQNPGYSKN
jgi:hypothetical protein